MIQKNRSVTGNRAIEITEAEQTKRIKGEEDSLRGLWDNTKHTNMDTRRVPEGEEKGAQNTFEEL